MNLIYISQHLNTHEKCIRFLEEKRWNNIPKCPYCQSEESSQKKLRYTCLKCSNSFSVTVGTIFENSNLPLNKWFVAIALILSAKKGLSSLQLSRDISVNKNTAWLLQLKIKRAMKVNSLRFLSEKKSLDQAKDSENSSMNNQNQDKKKVPSVKSYNFSKASGFWSLFKRALIGQYHKMDDRYISNYLDELHFKQRHKLFPDHGFDELLIRTFTRSFAKY